MLRQFHFIDQNGKDQGINVRNRAKELAELLSDVERIRSERKKARANRNKFGGVEGGAGMSGGFSSGGGSGSGGFSSGGGSGSGGGGRYGGFGSESAEYGAYNGGVYGDGGGFSGNTGPSFADTQPRRDRFDEYDEYDEGDVSSPPARRKEAAPAPSRREPKKEEPKPKAPEPVADLLAWDDEPAPVSSSAGKQPVAAAGNDFGDDDDFDDFQSAAPPAPVAPAARPAVSAFNFAPPASTSTITASTQFAAPQPQSATHTSNFNDLLATATPPPAANKMASPPVMSAASTFSQTPQQPSGYQATGPNYFTSVNMGAPKSGASTPSVMSPGAKIGGAAPKKSSGGDAFASLLAGAAPKKSGTPTQKVTMGDLAKQKTSQGLWGAPASSPSTPAQTSQSGSKPPGGALGDLLG
jgi:epsin